MGSIDHFITNRLIAERLVEADRDNLLRMDGDPGVMDPLGGVRSEAETREYLQRNLDHWDRHGFGLWMLSLLENSQFVGRTYLRHLRIGGNDELAIGYALLPQYWGMGLATEITAAIVDLAFSRLGLDNLVAGVRPDNAASRRVLDKVGAKYEKETTYKGAPHLLYRIAHRGIDL